MCLFQWCDFLGVYYIDEILTEEFGFDFFWSTLFLSFPSSLIISDFYIPKNLYFSFSLNVLMLSWFRTCITSDVCLCPRFINSIFFSMPNSIPISGLYIIIVSTRVSSSLYLRQIFSYHPYLYLVDCLALWYINLCRLFNAESIFKQIVCKVGDHSRGWP